MDEVVRAKVEQAVELLNEHDIPLWIVQFGRETHDHPDPVQRLAVGTSVTWPAAFIVCADGSTTAIVGTGDVSNVEAVGAYREVIGYVQDIAPPLMDVLTRHQPERIGLSYSLDDDQADSLTVGMRMMLDRCLQGSPFAERLVSADAVLSSLRARKSEEEVRRIRAAIGGTIPLFHLIGDSLHWGVTEREIASTVHQRMQEEGVSAAWDSEYDPVVSFGPDAPFGHSKPGERALGPGMLVHVDLGVQRDGYCSDLQRTWYVLPDGEREAPAEVRTAFETLVRALQAGFDALRPGVPGREVDAAARGRLVEAGYPEPQFALGHQLGQSTHDGGALLGPPWPRYGNRPDLPIEPNSVFTLEFALRTPAGTIGLEEDVLVTASGAEYLTAPQTELRYVRLDAASS